MKNFGRTLLSFWFVRLFKRSSVVSGIWLHCVNTTFWTGFLLYPHKVGDLWHFCEWGSKAVYGLLLYNLGLVKL